MKRYFALCLILSMLLTISACGGPAVVPTTIPTTAPVTELHSTEPPVTEAPATEPLATEPPATEPPATEPPATEPPATEPPVNNTEMSFDQLASMYCGRWYLDGYFDVYIDISLHSDGNIKGNDSLDILAYNFAMPSPQNDGVVYPDLQNLNGYSSGFGIIRHVYDYSKLKSYKSYYQISFK